MHAHSILSKDMSHGRETYAKSDLAQKVCACHSALLLFEATFLLATGATFRPSALTSCTATRLLTGGRGCDSKLRPRTFAQEDGTAPHRSKPRCASWLSFWHGEGRGEGETVLAGCHPSKQTWTACRTTPSILAVPRKIQPRASWQVHWHYTWDWLAFISKTRAKELFRTTAQRLC